MEARSPLIIGCFIEYNEVVIWFMTMLGCDRGLNAALTLSPNSWELAALESATEVRILRGGMDLTLDEPDALDAFIEALAVESAIYDATYPQCMPSLWLSFSDDARQPLASVVFCDASGSGVVQFEALGARRVSLQRASSLRRLATESFELARQ